MTTIEHFILEPHGNEKAILRQISKEIQKNNLMFNYDDFYCFIPEEITSIINKDISHFSIYNPIYKNNIFYCPISYSTIQGKEFFINEGCFSSKNLPIPFNFPKGIFLGFSLKSISNFETQEKKILFTFKVGKIIKRKFYFNSKNIEYSWENLYEKWFNLKKHL